MKKTIGLFAFFLICSCNQQNKMKNIKDDLLYGDSKGNVFLKRQIDIMSEKQPQNDQSRFFNLVLYKDSTYLLKDIVDVKTFHFVKSITDTISINKFDIFEDKTHIYKFQHLPPTSPEIKASDK